MSVAYTLLVHDERYPNMLDQIVGIFSDDPKKAIKAAHKHWADLGGPDAMPLNFTSYDSSNTKLDFHVGNVYRENGGGKVNYSINGFKLE